MKRVIKGLMSACVLAAACAPRQLTVPVEAGPLDLAALMGEWTGTYEMREGMRRTGDILFDLKAGTDTAIGSVIMTFRPDPSTLDPRVYPGPPVSEQLEISFVRATGNRVSGELKQYRDPDCGCRLRTVFLGRLRGDRIEGTFTSYHLDSGSVTTGTWHATRRRATHT